IPATFRGRGWPRRSGNGYRGFGSRAKEAGMNAVLRSLRLSELFSARAKSRAHDELADLVLGPRLCDLLAACGVPERDWLRVSLWLGASRESRDDHAFGAYVDVLVAERCRRPGDDLVSDLVAHEVDGVGLTADEIRAIVVGLALART